MAAIWGILSHSESNIQPELSVSMKKRMEKYKIDRIDDLLSDKFYFACGHQYFTPEAVHEILPYHDKERNIFFTADCILDNRPELVQELHITDADIPDGLLSYHAYLTWGERFVEHLLGAFSFAIYVPDTDTFLLYTDHVGNRCINYSLQGQTLYFCTTYDLFKECFSSEQLKLSEKWITACESEPSACMLAFPGLTPFEGVFQLKAAHYIKYTNGKLSEIQYWKPQKCKKIHYQEEQQYKDLVVQTFRKCVEDLLRPGTQIAANLSSGLDSTSIVSIAAPFLEKRGEILHTYTSIPDEAHDYESDAYFVPDESSAVKKTVACFPNIKSHFIDCKGENALTHLKKFVEEYDLPIKSAINLSWIYQVNHDAHARGCTIQLTGQMGNGTLSYGDILSLTYHQMRTFHLIQAKQSIHDFLIKNHVPKKYFLHTLYLTWKEKLFDYFGISTGCRNEIVRTDLMKKYHIKYQGQKLFHSCGNGSMLTNTQRCNAMCSLISFQQIGLYNTISSLLHGIIERDPTKDKRMIELCLSLPLTCFVSHGIERYLVRGYLADILPEHITTDTAHRGLQGGDYIYRLARSWEQDRLNILETINNPQLSAYLKQDKINEMITFCRTHRQLNPKCDSDLIIHLLYTVSLSYYLSICISKH